MDLKEPKPTSASRASSPSDQAPDKWLPSTKCRAVIRPKMQEMENLQYYWGSSNSLKPNRVTRRCPTSCRKAQRTGSQSLTTTSMAEESNSLKNLQIKPYCFPRPQTKTISKSHIRTTSPTFTTNCSIKAPTTHWRIHIRSIPRSRITHTRAGYKRS